MESVLQRVLLGQSRGELWKKNHVLQWKQMELGGVPQKIDDYFTGDLYSM